MAAGANRVHVRRAGAPEVIEAVAAGHRHVGQALPDGAVPPQDGVVVGAASVVPGAHGPHVLRGVEGGVGVGRRLHRGPRGVVPAHQGVASCPPPRPPRGRGCRRRRPAWSLAVTRTPGRRRPPPGPRRSRR